MLSRQEEEQERRETLENDRKLLEAERQRILREGTTFHQFAQSQIDDEAGGRFRAISPKAVIGAAPIPSYPAASTSWQIQLPDEPPLGFDNPALDETSTVHSPVGATGDPVAAPPAGIKPAPTGSLVSDERAGSPSINQTTEERDNG
jgi:hypothetical protein